MNKFLGLLLVLICLYPKTSHAQKLDSMMNVYAESFPQEKIYVHFDKSVYNSGETIWFKAYIFSGAFPSLVSKNFYVELADANGNILQRKTAPVLESTASGSFDLPANITGTHLHFRAYTMWMMNFDTAFVFNKELRILTSARDSTASAPVAKDRKLQFFAEGGDLVAGLESNIAFKATDQAGLPVAVKGVLKDASGKDVLEFNTVHDGMGKFMITPDKADMLYAVWKDDLGKEHRTDLPAVKPAGVVLKLMTGDKKVFFSIARSADSAAAFSHLIVVGHMHQHLVYKAKTNLEENFMSGGTIPVEQLPSGILQVTVFNDHDQPLAERVIFVNNHDYEFMPQLRVTAKSIVRRGRNEIEITVPDTLRSNFSVAITDEEADDDKLNEDNIISGLLLTGDLRGYIHDPYYYFSETSPDSAKQYLDLVMLTHGWRRFKWEQLAKGKTPVIKFPDQNYITAKAEVLGVDASHVSKDEFVNLILKKKDSSTQMMQIPHLSGLKFGVGGLIFYDTAQAYYSFNMNRKLSSEAAVVFTNGLYAGNKRIRSPDLPVISWTAADSAMLRKNRMITAETSRIKPLMDQKVKTLASVTVRGRQKTPAEKLSEKYASGLFSSADAHIFDLVDDQFAVAYPDIFTYLQGKVAGLQINANGPNVTMTWRGATPGVYLNEMQADVSMLRNIAVSDIALVKVFPPGSGIGFGGGAGGSIAVYTKKGGDSRPDESFKGLDRARIVGYSPVKEFYSPDYAHETPDNEAIDIRTTLYWNPFIVADKFNRTTLIQFYNNDISKRVRIIIEGVNEEGKLARIEKSLQ